MSEMTIEEKIKTNTWEDNFDEVAAAIKDFTRGDADWSWARNMDCKYVSIRIDMRDGGFVLLDRKGERISLEKLKYQYRDDQDKTR